MSRIKKLSHVIYYHVYHIVWTPKYRYKVLSGPLKEFLEDQIKSLCEWNRVEILEMNVQTDHVHVILYVPPKLSISNLMGILKGKTAIKIFKSYPGLKKKPLLGKPLLVSGILFLHSWSR